LGRAGGARERAHAVREGEEGERPIKAAVSSSSDISPIPIFMMTATKVDHIKSMMLWGACKGGN